MPRIVWINPAHPRTQQYITTDFNDANVPAGYVLTSTSDGSWQGADSVIDQNLQTQVAGLAGGGYPTYNGYTDGSGNGPNPNGHLGGN